MAEHTPLPWHVYDQGIGWEIEDQNNENINDGFRETFTKEDAEFIVCAVNSYYPLLEALKKYVECFGDPAEGKLIGARALIARAEGRSNG